MRLRGGTVLFSPHDLVASLECELLTVLDFQAVGDADMRAGRSALDESAELIARKGDQHGGDDMHHVRIGSRRPMLRRQRVLRRASVLGGSVRDRSAFGPRERPHEPLEHRPRFTVHLLGRERIEWGPEARA